MPRRSLSSAQLRQIHQARRWAELWRLDPGKMEACRRAATLAAVSAKKRKNDRLRELVSAWPSSIAPTDLKALVLELAKAPSPYRRGKRYNPRSVLNRLRRHGMLSFDHATGLWTNACRPAIENLQGQGINLPRVLDSRARDDRPEGRRGLP